jgi:hypothetical protein
MKEIKQIFSNKILLVLLLGFGIRLFACVNTFIVNPDGIQYIHQARAIYYGEWQDLTHCSVSYVSNLPFLIAGAYAVVRDWIIAARAASVLFGFAALIPLYFLLKRFFDENVSALCTLIYALIPIFVSRSAGVVRGPVYWFFSLLALYFFVSQIGQGQDIDEKTYNRRWIYLASSNLSFLMATWARIEALLFIIVSGCYIVFTKQEKKIERLAFFVSPMVLIILVCLSGAAIFDVSVNEFHRGHEVLGKFSRPMDSYRELRASLKELAALHREDLLGEFLPKARNTIWLVAFGTLLNRALEAFFYPFFLVFFIGMVGSWQRIKSDTRVRYLFLLSVSGVVLLYMHVMETWVMMYRFLAIVIIPTCIFAGFGLEKIIRFVRSKFGLKESVALIVVTVLILVAGLPKNLKPKEADKAVFRQIGEMIAKREGNDRITTVAAAPSAVQQWVSFYANLNYPGAPCLRYPGTIGEDYRQFVEYLRQNNIKYFLWEENRWPVGTFDFIHAPYHQDFKELGRWRHRDTERVILFELTGAE